MVAVAVGGTGVGVAVDGIGVAVGCGLGVGVARGAGLRTTAALTGLPQATEPTGARDVMTLVIRPPFEGTVLTVDDLRPTDTNVRVLPSGDHTGVRSLELPGVIFR